MADEQDLFTIFRSPDRGAREEAEEIRELLREAGIEALVVDDATPGVVGGTIEVRVPLRDAQLAEKILAAEQEQAGGVMELDTSRELDLETVFASSGVTAEMEALTIRSILEAGGLSPVLVGASAIPSLSFEVRVPGTQLDEARRLIAEAQQAGPQAADDAEGAGEPRL